MTSSWLAVASDSDFSLANLPLGVASTKDDRRRCVTRLGDTIIDLGILEEAGLFEDIVPAYTFCGQATLNSFVALPRPTWRAMRQQLVQLLTAPSSREKTDNRLQTNSALRAAAFYSVDSITMHLPVTVGDYTDFYSSREHATNVGTMFRGKDNALQPNWLHLPVGYHGRSSTVVITGTPIRRPMGQLQKDRDDPKQGSIFGACKMLDFELEMAAVVGGPPNPHGTRMSLDQAKEHIFGFVLMNDWSARDIQRWEYVPLGPFTSKNFATTISPWIVMTEALEEHGFIAPTSAKEQVDPVPLPYLQDPEYSSYDVALTVSLKAENQDTPTVVSRSNFCNMYWNAAQQLAHHSVTGCTMKAGDLLGSGTISGTEPDSFGSMLELCWKGTREVKVGDQVRKFLQDGDTVTMQGVCSKADGQARIGFGDCSGTILPALAEVSADSASTPHTESRYKNFRLFSYWRSSSTWRVRIQLAAKGIPFETIPIDLLKGENRTEEFMAKNPIGQVPLLEFSDLKTGETVCIAQSMAIIELLDTLFPSKPSLVPRDPIEAALALEMADLVIAGTQPLQNIVYLRDLESQSGGVLKATDLAKAANINGLSALEVLVKRRRTGKGSAAGPYCLANFAPTIADACLVPQLYNARRFGVDVATLFPELLKIESVCLKHPWFRPSHPSFQPDAPESER